MSFVVGKQEPNVMFSIKVRSGQYSSYIMKGGTIVYNGAEHVVNRIDKIEFNAGYVKVEGRCRLKINKKKGDKNER